MKELNLDLKRLKAERVAKGLDQEQFAKKIGMSRVSYWKRENGLVDISVNELAKMIQALGYGKENVSLFFTQSVPKKQQKGKNNKKEVMKWRMDKTKSHNQ